MQRGALPVARKGETSSPLACRLGSLGDAAVAEAQHEEVAGEVWLKRPTSVKAHRVRDNERVGLANERLLDNAHLTELIRTRDACQTVRHRRVHRTIRLGPRHSDTCLVLIGQPPDGQLVRARSEDECTVRLVDVVEIEPGLDAWKMNVGVDVVAANHSCGSRWLERLTHHADDERRRVGSPSDNVANQVPQRLIVPEGAMGNGEVLSVFADGHEVFDDAVVFDAWCRHEQPRLSRGLELGRDRAKYIGGQEIGNRRHAISGECLVCGVHNRTALAAGTLDAPVHDKGAGKLKAQAIRQRASFVILAAGQVLGQAHAFSITKWRVDNATDDPG